MYSLNPLLVQGLFFYIVSWACWQLLRWVSVRSPLDNIPGPPSKSFWKGNLRELFSFDNWEFIRHISENYGPVVRINGLLGDKQLLVYDPKALNHIIVKDQYIYEETSTFIESNLLVFGPGLLSTLGDHHRKQRKMMNPVFSIAHMRHITPTFYKTTYKVRDCLVSKLKNGPEEVDMVHWMSRLALELLGQGGLGYSFDELKDGSESANPYTKSVKALGSTALDLLITRQIVPWFVKIGSPRFRRWLVTTAPWENIRRMGEIVDVMHKTSLEVFNAKKQALREGDDAVVNQVGQGKDIMSILLKANMETSEGERLPDFELLAQMSTLTFAAMDTTSSALSSILYLLAQHQDVQDKLRKEITEARLNKGDLPYDELVGLPYLDSVCRETLRLYPPIPLVSRTTRKDVILPLSKPIRGCDGTEIHDIFLPNNTNVVISITQSNRDPKRWGTDAGEWKPERWLSPLPASVNEEGVPGVYSNTLTFLGGGRSCIGLKFSQLEMKVVLSLLIESFRFSPPEKEIVWRSSVISLPVMKGTGLVPKLPLKVELVERSTF